MKSRLLCMTAVVVGLAMTASAGTILVTDEYGAPIQGAVLTVTPFGGSGLANVVPGSEVARELRGSYSVGVTGPAMIEFTHGSYGTLYAKGDFSNGEAIELIVDGGQDGFSMRHLGDAAPTAGSSNRAGNANCATATVIPWASIIAAAGYTDSGSTFSPGTQTTTCGINGSDAFYTFTAGATTTLDFTTCVGGNPTDTVLQVRNGVCGATVACSDDSCTVPPGGNTFNSTLTNVPVVNGQVYTIQIDNWASTAAAPYTVKVSTPFELAPPVGGCTDEGEPLCGLTVPPAACAPADFTNGGCNVNPPLFSSVSCGETICGTYGNCGAARDTDWYTYVETSIRLAQWCCIGEGAGLYGLVNNNGGSGLCPATAFQAFSLASAGNQVCVKQLLFPGTWFWFAATSNFAGQACGLEYQCTLNCTCPGPCVDPVVSSEGSAPLQGGAADARIR